MTTSALKKCRIERADVVIGPYAVDKLTPRQIGIFCPLWYKIIGCKSNQKRVS